MRSIFSLLAAAVLIAITGSPVFALPAIPATPSCLDVSVSIVLQADSGSGRTITGEELEQNRRTIVQRLIRLGIDDAVVMIAGDNQIDITFPRAGDATDEVLQTIQQTGLLEIIDTQGEYLEPGTYVTTSLSWASSAATPAASIGPVYETVVDSTDISSVYPTTDSVGQPAIGFILTDQAADDMFSYTSSHIQQPMSIVFDKQIVSSPVISAPIAEEGIIVGLDPTDVPAVMIALDSNPLRFPMSITETNIDAESTPCADPAK